MSKVLIAYASKHGCTEECAKTLAGKMTASADLWNLKEKKQPDLNAYDKIVIGGAMYAGRIMKEVRDFCAKNESILEKKKLGLFICGTALANDAKKQIETSFPQGLLDRALTKENFGGKLILNNLNFFERKAVKIVAKVEADMSNVSESRIDQFAKAINEA